jgi:hypothetical protein
MAEEKEESTGTSIKSIIIGLISTVTLGVGGFITTKLTGGEEKEVAPAAAPVINIQNTQNQSQSAGGKTVIIKEKEAAAKPAPAPKKKEGDEFKEAEPKW